MSRTSYNPGALKGVVVTLYFLPSGRFIAYGENAALVQRFRGDEGPIAPAIVERATELTNFSVWAIRQGAIVTLQDDSARYGRQAAGA